LLINLRDIGFAKANKIKSMFEAIKKETL